ncbi:MAG: hypothetical protein IPO37_12035 [Saprospiraceae bacterium]|nr:hypothetical protein [Saprospiraceae bacterium]
MKFLLNLITIPFLVGTALTALSQTKLQFIPMADKQFKTPILYRKCNIVTLGFHNLDGKYDLAVDEQLGVIGSDFIGSLKIGKAPAEGHYQ